ncbi:24560_t:CDS:1, partial [Gigaspora margarita]
NLINCIATTPSYLKEHILKGDLSPYLLCLYSIFISKEIKWNLTFDESLSITNTPTNTLTTEFIPLKILTRGFMIQFNHLDQPYSTRHLIKITDKAKLINN